MLISLLLACAFDEPRVPTWHADVSPALQTWCTRCHQAGGQGTGDFTDYETAVDFAELMVQAIDDGSMSPPTSDPDCNDFVGSEHLVADPELAALLEDWIDAGAPLGNRLLAPEVEAVQEELQDPDLSVRIPAYTPRFEDEGDAGNEYRCFVLEHGIDEEFWITAMAPVLDSRELLHHMVLFAAEEDFIPSDDSPKDGFDCIDDAFIGGNSANSVLDGNGMIGAWGPGAVPLELPEGVGLRVTPDQRLILQIHYFQSASWEPGLVDRSGYAFHIAGEDEIDETALLAPMGVYNFSIPPGDDDYTASLSFEMPLDLSVHAVFPHMHVLGKAWELKTEGDQGEQCITRGERWDFDNQLSYVFEDAVEIDAGDTITMSCTWDNSADNPNQLHDEPQWVGYGERTDEEMCFGFSMVSLGH